ESQRQVFEGYSAFARQRLPKFDKPDVESIEGLLPTVTIAQKRIGGTSRSTVGTVTEIYTLLRVLFSRAAEPHPGASSLLSFNTHEGACPTCEGTGTVMTLDTES
ncbi:hypothetical protein KIPB_015167, partial [Kipferlia bialata]